MAPFSFGFIASFFVSKQIFSLTAYTCWPPDATAQLVRTCARAGLVTRVLQEPGRVPAPAARPRGTRREGVLLDAGCPHADHLLAQASDAHAFTHLYSWLLLHDSINSSTEFLDSTEILPDSDVTWLSADDVVEVYRVKWNEPLIEIQLEMTRNDSLREMDAMWRRRWPAVRRRHNLRNVYLSTAVVITEPQNFKGWSDLTNRQIDTFPKLTYPLMKLLADDLNYRQDTRQLVLFGATLPNGSFNGLAEALQRRRVVVGASSIFMRADRWHIMDFVAETCELRGAFIFRQPSQSSVSNVFLLPFSRGVWAASGAVLAAAAALLAALAARLRRQHPGLDVLTLPESVSFAIGTICQQGSHVTPDVLSVRVVMFSALVCSLFAFTAYSAKIVAILQAPSHALQTIDDLTRSPMACGVQNTTYKRVYFAESSEPATQRLYRHKLLPYGDSVYLSVAEGVRRLRTGLFAFQAELSSGYDVISKTFTEAEKCGLQEIPAFRLPMVAIPLSKHSGYKELFATRLLLNTLTIPLSKHSGYKELFATRLRWQREAGLTAQARRRWLTERPRCADAGGGFLSVRLMDVLPAFQILGYGGALAALLLGAERAVHAARRAAPDEAASSARCWLFIKGITK